MEERADGDGGAAVLSLAQLGSLSSYKTLTTAVMLNIFFLQSISGGFYVGLWFYYMDVYVPCPKQIHLYTANTPYNL